jgi:hypothetical protein
MLMSMLQFEVPQAIPITRDKGPLVADKIPDAIIWAEFTVKIPCEFGAQNQSEEGGDLGTCIFKIFSAVVDQTPEREDQESKIC